MPPEAQRQSSDEAAAAGGSDGSSEPRKPPAKPSIFTDINPFCDTVSLFTKRLSTRRFSSRLVHTGQGPDHIFKSEGGLASMAESPEQSRRSARKSTLPVNECYTICRLALTKGEMYSCVICHSDAVLGCSKCGVTHYCSWEHRNVDTGHSSVCEKLKIIHAPIPYRFEDLERRRLKSQRLLVMEKLMEDMVKDGYASLSNGHFEKAEACLIRSLNYVVPVFGNDSFLLKILIYTALTQTYLGMEDFDSAHKMVHNTTKTMFNAEALFAQETDKFNNVVYTKAIAYKTEGLYYYATGQYQDAIKHFSESIYYFGEMLLYPTHFRSSLCYLFMGKCFLGQGNPLVASKLIEFALKICLDYLHELMIEFARSRSAHKSERLLSLYAEIEAKVVIRECSKFIAEEINEYPHAACCVDLCKAIIALLKSRFDDVAKHLKKNATNLQKVRDPKLSSLHRQVKQLSKSDRMTLLFSCSSQESVNNL